MKTKILVTLGPSICDYDVIRKLVEEGVSGFRINYTQSDRKTWDEWFKIIREVSTSLDKTVSIIGDIPGPQIRIGDFEQYSVNPRDRVLLVYGDKTSDRNTIPVPIKKFFETVEIGDIILLDDGKVILRVIDCDQSANTVEALVLNSATILPRKKIVISGKDIELPLLSNRDIELIKYSIDRGVNYIAISFVRRAEDISSVRRIIDNYGGFQGIIAKIETRSSVYELDSIVRESDAVLIARGDLGLHFDLEKIPLIQREIAKKSIEYSKPCILATQLLESMIHYPRPSRSEVVDIMNAVNDMVDALLLTSETAIGKYPVEAVKWLKKIIEVSENNISYDSINSFRNRIKYVDLRDKHALGLLLLSERIGAKIVIFTKTGFLPSHISRIRPQVDVYVGSNNKIVAEKLTIYYGLKPFYLSNLEGEIDYDTGVAKLYEYLKKRNELKYGEVVVEAYSRKEAGIYEIRIKQVV
ncbi:MAG: pyruvate kinase [Desulfurococcaceae archaeon]